MVAWSCKTLKKNQTFCVFCKNDPLRENFKIFFRKFSSRHWSTCCVQISWNSADRKSVKSNRALLTWQKISPGSPALATARIASRICQDQPRQCTQSAPDFFPNRFTFGAVIPERVNTIKTGRKVFPIFGWSLALSRINSRPTAKRNTNIATHADHPFWHSSMNDVSRESQFHPKIAWHVTPFLGEIDSPSPSVTFYHESRNPLPKRRHKLKKLLTKLL